MATNKDDDIGKVYEKRIKDFYGAEFDEDDIKIDASEDEVIARKLPPILGEFDKGIIIYEPSEDSRGWFTIGSESYQPDKEDFIVTKFKEDFKNIKGVESVEKIGKLASRSPSLNEWLIKTNLGYSLEANIPLWAKDIIPPATLKTLEGTIQETNKVEVERSDALNSAAIEYKAKIAKINTQCDNKQDKIKEIDLSLAFICNSTTLPLSIQLAIENYSPADADAPTKKTYARELLLQWRQQLTLRKLADPSFSVSDFIKGQALK